MPVVYGGVRAPRPCESRTEEGPLMVAYMQQDRGIHLVGSVPLDSAEDVFRTASDILGARLRRLPDGETGLRAHWIGWQYAVFRDHPAFARIPLDPAEEAALPPEMRSRHFALRPGATTEVLTFENLGYADAALNSYATFARLKGEGVIPAHCRFQVSLPTPLAPVANFVVLPAQAMVLPAYQARLLDEVDAITAAIPRNQLAIQWDVAVEFGVLEGVWSVGVTDPTATMLSWLVELGEHLPGEVELGYHLCYGDMGHKHFTEPRDMATLAAVANHVSAGVHRPINWIHMPVPRARRDVAYFAPLATLQLRPETELYLGLVHYRDGVEGTRRRMTAAQRVVPHFGVATECGMARRSPETVAELLRMHAAVT
jgi:hypothetical protein